MRRHIGLLLLLGTVLSVSGQRVLTLDSCRQMALRNNKQLGISKLKQDVAANLRKSARTKYLPHVSAVGTYEYTSREISLLSDEQKTEFSNLGTAMSTGLGQALAPMAAQSQVLATVLGKLGPTVETMLNGLGQKIVDAFHTDTRNVFEARRQATLYRIDQAYWQVVSLYHKKKLAEGYLELVKKLNSDVHKMIDEGVATKSDGLSVEVKVNEAEMTLTKVDDGLVLSRMLLNQLCGLPLNEQITLEDEQQENIAVVELTPKLDVEKAVENRPELKLLQNSVALSKQATNVLKAGNMPQLLLTGGYAVSNPNLFDGFQRKFGGFWHVGVMLRIPVWNWGDVMYKVRASKGATSIANLELAEARELIELQVNQNTFKVDEANKKLTMAQANITRANENLRTANLGFSEGVITPATVMEAQTAWLQAQSQKIDAEIDVKLSQVDLQKALGTLE